MQTRAIVLSEKSKIASLDTYSLNKLQQGEILLKASYSSLNYKDALSVLAKVPIAKTYPLIAGLDVAGEVVESKSELFNVGDKVLVQGAGLGETINGGFCDYGVYPEDIVVKLPENLTEKQAMKIGTAGFTAALAVSRMLDNKQEADQGAVLVTGASGGVGNFAISFLSQKGFSVVAASSKKENSDFLKSLGASLSISYKELPYSESPISKSCFAGAIDCLGGEYLANLLKHMDMYANVVSVGMVSGTNFKTSVLPHIIRGVSLLGVSSTNYPISKRIRLWEEISRNYKLDFIEKLMIKEISLGGVLEASRELLSNKSSGRYIVKLGES